jgi:hypothetical protein
MDIKSLIGRITSARYFKAAAIAAGVLAIAAAVGAYYFFVFQPQEQSNTPAVAPPVVKKPQPAPAKPAAKPVDVQPLMPAPSAPPTAHQPAAATIAAPMPEITAQPAKPEPAVEKFAPEKRQTATKPEQINKPAEMDKANAKLDAQDTSQQVVPQSQDALPAPTPSPAESAPVEPAPERRGITPKYNDIMTAVLRGDREAAKELLDLGWWADKPGDNGITPLMAAVMNRDTQMVQLLLEHGAEPSVRAIELARKNKDAATATLLEQKGAR